MSYSPANIPSNSLYELSVYAFNLDRNASYFQSKKISETALNLLNIAKQNKVSPTDLEMVAFELLKKNFSKEFQPSIWSSSTSTLEKSYNEVIGILLDNYYLQGINPNTAIFQNLHDTFTDMIDTFLAREQDQERRFAFAKTCIKMNPSLTAKNFHKFGITDDQKIFEITKMCCFSLLDNIDNFNISDANIRYELAKLYIDDHQFHKNVQKFKLTDEQRAELACIYLKQEAHSLHEFFYNFKNYAIDDPSLQYQAALTCAKYNPFHLPLYFESFDLITDQDQIYEIAKTCVQTSSGAHSLQIYFKKFKIQDETRRLELLKMSLKKLKKLKPNQSASVYYINNFQIQSPIELIKILNKCARQNGTVTAECISAFVFEDPTQKYQIAKLCVLNGDNNVPKHLKNFDIGSFNPKQRFKLALLAAQKNGMFIASNITDWNIEEPEQLYQIAQACAAQDGGGLKEQFSQFKVVDPERILNLVKLSTKNNGLQVAKLFPTFNITSPEEVFVVAKLCFENAGPAVCKHLKNFNITDSNKLYELFQMSANYNRGGVHAAEIFEHFHITEPEKLFEAAKLCAHQSVEATFKNINKFKIQSEEQYFELIKLCFEIHPYVALVNFKDFAALSLLQKIELAIICAKLIPEFAIQSFYLFEIRDLNIAYDIVKTCAENNPEDTSTYFNYLSLSRPGFNIFDRHSPLNPKQRFEIASICAQNNPYSAMFNLGKFDLDESNALAVFNIALGHNPIAVLKAFSQFSKCFSDSMRKNVKARLKEEVIRELFQGNLEGDYNLRDLDEINPLYQFFYEFYSKNTSDLVETLKKVMSTFSPHEGVFQTILSNILSHTLEKDLKTHLHSFALLLLGAQEFLKPEDLQWCLNNNGLSREFKEVMVIRAPSLRPQLLKGLIDSVVKNQERKYPELASFKTRFPLIMQSQLRNLLDHHVSLTDIMALNMRLKTGKTAFLRDKIKVQTLLKVLLLLNETPGDHSTILKKVLTENKDTVDLPDQKQILRNLYNLITIIELDGYDKLHEDISLKALADTLFKDKFFIVNTENISERFEATFNSSRNPQAIRTLAGKYAMGEMALRESLGDFIASVLNETYRQDRYNPALDLHLRELEKRDPGIIETWWSVPERPIPVEENRELQPKMLSESELFDWIKDKLVVHHHLNLSQFPNLENFLNNRTVINFEASSSNETDLDHLRRTFEQNCIAALSCKTREDFNNHLRMIKNVMQALRIDTEEFLNDINAFLTEKSSEGEWEAVDTDDPIDLLLCGTEILGSCQRVDGVVALNQGLEGYIKNGRTRMCAIKNKVTFVNRSRMMTKLLFSSEGGLILFIEKMYPETISDSDKNDLIKIAMQKAKKRNIPLIQKADQGKQYPYTISSYQCRAVSDYSDAASGVLKRGVTSISEGLVVLYQPLKKKRPLNEKGRA